MNSQKIEKSARLLEAILESLLMVVLGLIVGAIIRASHKVNDTFNYMIERDTCMQDAEVLGGECRVEKEVSGEYHWYRIGE